MLGLESLLFFVFVFSALTLFRLLIITLVSLFSDNPKSLELGNKGLVFYGLIISYIITFLLKLL
jgi:hypothetical protein